ncbi:MAG: AraC family transcriptional regulator [Devosia sp.]
MRPYLEKLPIEPNASWSTLNRRLDGAIPFQWHHHPEFELTLTLNSRGQRFIGDHVGEYGEADLVLVGPNLPHTWSSSDKIDPAQPHRALVLWFRHEWADQLMGDLIEFQRVKALLARAHSGLQFSAPLGEQLQPQFEAIFTLPPAARLLSLLAILDRLADDDHAIPLASRTAPHSAPTESRERIDRILTHIHIHYAEGVSLDELADIAALSLSGLHRLFLKHTQTSISDYLTRLRIGDSCARLSGTDQPIQHIASAVGFNSLANFNRQFKRLRAMTPRQYRQRFR